MNTVLDILAAPFSWATLALRSWWSWLLFVALVVFVAVVDRDTRRRVVRWMRTAGSNAARVFSRKGRR